MNKTLLMSLIVLTTLSFISLSSCTQEPEREYLIGIINPNSKLDIVVDSFKNEMAARGYIEGKNTVYIDAEAIAEPGMALTKFRDREVDMVLTMTTPPMKRAVDSLHASGIPVVGLSFDPVRGGVVESVVYKKRNVTGIQTGGSVQKALEWFLLIVPDIERIFVPVTFDTPAAALSLSDLREAALKLDVKLHVQEVASAEELWNTMASITDDTDAVFILHSILVVSNLDIILAACEDRNIPSASGSALYRQGVTISYGQDIHHMGKRLALAAHKVLTGIPAFSLPFDTSDFSLGINLDSADKIGLHIPYYYINQSETVGEQK